MSMEYMFSNFLLEYVSLFLITFSSIFLILLFPGLNYLEHPSGIVELIGPTH